MRAEIRVTASGLAGIQTQDVWSTDLYHSQYIVWSPTELPDSK
jgi:hypothetical protein